MRKKLLLNLSVLLLIVTSCKKQIAGGQGEEGLKSLVDIKNISSNTSCPAGGIVIKSGIDKNKNDRLDSAEIQSTNYICNGQNGQDASSDKQIMLPINFSANTTSINPTIAGGLIKFNKKNYPNVDSIILVSNPYVGDATNTSNIELYNMTDNVAINKSKLTTNSLYETSSFIQTGNLYDQLPDYDITIGMSLKSGSEGKFAATGTPYLFLFRK
jgi:hypothetical protein